MGILFSIPEEKAKQEGSSSNLVVIYKSVVSLFSSFGKEEYP